MQTIKSIGLKTSRLPRMLGELTHSIQFLKIFCLGSLVVAILQASVLALIANRPPVILTLTPSAIPLEQVEQPKAEEQIRAAIRRYVDKRYGWEPGTVVRRLKEAQAFILPQSLRAFQAALAEVSRFSTERQVTQRAYPAEEIQIDLTKKTAFLTGDRITSIQGLKAAGNLKLALSFEAGPQTAENPWGVYITKEREEP